MNGLLVMGYVIAVVILLALLSSCMDSPSCGQRRRRRPSGEGRYQDGRYYSNRVPTDVYNQRSNWGQGVDNRRTNRAERDLINLNGYDDYNAVTKFLGLDREVIDSQEEYNSNTVYTSRGASTLSTTSHDNYPVPFVGLRRPNMKATYAKSGARTEHTEFVDQMPDTTCMLIC